MGKRDYNFCERFHELEEFNRCPLPVFLTQYPMIQSGIGKNGAIIEYVKVGQINIPGLECIVGDIANAVLFMWYQLYHATRRAMEREIDRHDANTTTVLAEKILVADLAGDTALFGAGRPFLTAAPDAGNCFAEAMNRTYVLNAPYSFSMIWSVAKHALEPRTLQKIGFFSSMAKAKKDFANHIDSNELLSEYG